MQIEIVIQGKDDKPKLDVVPPVIDISSSGTGLATCVIEEGMQSGEPSVIISQVTTRGTFIIQTSLDRFLTAAVAMATAARDAWGWEMPEGYATIIPDISDERIQEIVEEIEKEFGQKEGDSGD